MPTKFTVGLSKKIGRPDYGSIGASCHVEVELDSSIFQNDMEKFHQHVRRAYVACAQAVNDELARNNGQQSGPQQAPLAAPQQALPPAPPQNSNGVHPVSNGTVTNGKGASAKQFDYANRLASDIKGLGVRRLEDLARKMFNKSMAALTSLDASGLIDTLKEIKAGNINLDAALNGVTP